MTLAWISKGRDKRVSSLAYFIPIVPVIIWCTYAVDTAREAFAITSLDSENNIYAEAVYETSFDTDLEETIRLASDKNQTGNVRFYAGCRIADILATNRMAYGTVLERVAGIPGFRTGFGGTNHLTCGFFTPNYTEGPFTVREIVDRRLWLKGNFKGAD